MSKISYCSLEEAWGDSYVKDNNKDNNKNIYVNNNDSSNNDSIKSHNSVNDTRLNYLDEKSIKNVQNNRISNRDRYEILNKKSDIERDNVIKNMNNIERNTTTENNQLVEYNKFRFNSSNNVEDNNYKQDYSPFNESIEKKYLKDKLIFLENELKKYKYLIDKSESNDYIENFSNENNNSVQNQNHGSDIIDLILLIIIGLIIIFVLNSIFNIGKSIGSKHK